MVGEEACVAKLFARHRARRLGREPALDRRPLVREAVGRDDGILKQLLRDRADERRRRALVRLTAGRAISPENY